MRSFVNTGFDESIKCRGHGFRAMGFVNDWCVCAVLAKPQSDRKSHVGPTQFQFLELFGVCLIALILLNLSVVRPFFMVIM